jgi:hypothetical protein
MLVPGKSLPNHTSNEENPELYPVHPYFLFNVASSGVEMAINAYHKRIFPCNVGWCQDIMDAALLGMIDIFCGRRDVFCSFFFRSFIPLAYFLFLFPLFSFIPLFSLFLISQWRFFFFFFFFFLSVHWLGLTRDAVTQVISRALTPPAIGYRFPGFSPHLQDYEPSVDHLANMNNALQWMLLQPGVNPQLGV